MDHAQEIEVAAMSRLKPMNDVIGLGDSEIQRFYNNSVVFITGGSGFLGKQLIEKLLRSCNISKVFLLLRSKKGKSTQQRLDAIVNEPVFDSLRKQKPDFADKIVILEGDAAAIKLGLKDVDWKTIVDKLRMDTAACDTHCSVKVDEDLLSYLSNNLTNIQQVDAIFHAAATTKFDETLKVATLINVRGTREILQLAKACKKLKTFVHVSTAYSHATTTLIRSEVEEEFYKSSVPPETMISMVETMEEQRLIDITPQLIKNWPNTYTFTKSIAEEQVRTMSDGLPICIVRPGVVLCSYTEPSPGWLDISCIYGATGFVVGLALGLLRTLYIKVDAVLGIVPCDYVNNAIIAAGRETATNQSKGGNNTKIYTVTSTRRNPIKWEDITRALEDEGPKIQTPAAIAYSYAYDTNYKFIYMILSLFLHLIPAYIADFVCLLMGKERRFAKTSRKVYNMCEILSFFLINEWNFVDDNLNKLYNSLSNRDKVIFNFDITDVNWNKYVLIWCIGVRKYILKDGLKGTQYAIKKQKLFRIATYIFMSLYIYVLWKIFYLVFYICSNVLTTLINFF